MNTILYAKELQLTFLSNAKVGCSTIKKSMLGGYEGKIHHKAREEFSLPENLYAPIFGLTRNPYSRALSCYKDKILINKDKNVWPGFCKKYGFSPDSTPTFIEYLTALSKDEKPEKMDVHYRPQYFNLFHEDITPRYTGRLENMNDVQSFLDKFGVELYNHAPHAQNASQTYQDEISPEEAELIYQIYKVDFDTYGYSQDLSSHFVPEPKYQEQKISEKFQMMFFSNKCGLDADNWRDLSVQYQEKGNIEKSYKLMKVAGVLRPNGPFIKQQIKKLDKLLTEKK